MKKTVKTQNLLFIKRDEFPSFADSTTGVPVAVPDKIFGLTLILDFIDRCHSLASFLPPPAAVGSLPIKG